MKYWKLLFLCFAINSCNIENDSSQPLTNKTELRTINKSVYINYAPLATLKEIAFILKYEISLEKSINSELEFYCDSSSEVIKGHEKEIKELLERPLEKCNVFTKVSPDVERNLKPLLNDEDFKKTILQTLSVENADGGDIISTLASVIKKFMEWNGGFFSEVGGNLEEYKKKLKGGKIQKSVEAFITLSGFLKNLCEDYVGKIDGLEDEQIISLFFCNFLVQYFNIYYENIFRVKQMEDGSFVSDLSLLGAIQ